MQAIHVKRYATPGVWAGTIEPEDRNWIVFVASDGAASFWRRTSAAIECGAHAASYEPAASAP